MNIIIICNDSSYSVNFLGKINLGHNYTVISPTKPYPNKGIYETLQYVRKTRGSYFLFSNLIRKIKNKFLPTSSNTLKFACKKLDFKLIKCKILESDFLISEIKKLNPDIICSISLNHKVPKELFSLSKIISFNIHPSLLPSYRGPSPIFWVLNNKEEYSGISIHELTSDFDKGKIIYQKKYSISGMNEKELYAKSSDKSADCFNHLIDNLPDLPDLELDSSIQESYFPRPSYEKRTGVFAK